MRSEMITKLTTGIASSADYRAAVKEATVPELKAASTKMHEKKETKTRIAACDRELRMRRAVKMERSTKLIIILFAIHELLLMILGMSIALTAESKGTDGTHLIFPLALMLIALGWMLRDVRSDSRK